MNRLATVSLLLLSTLTAQTGNAVQQSFGVTTHAGVVCGLGRDYSARFAPHGVTFTPALGNGVERPQTLQFTLAAVRRGATDVWQRTGNTAPSIAGNTVRYQHTHELAETYDVRADGIEQSFVFAVRPAGSGDLVVRGEITTELPLVHVGGDGARFERDEAGGVSFGAVTGVDANGARIRGGLRMVGNTLELTLPAAFVDSATYPLVLDPLIGSVFGVASTANASDFQPSVAFDTSTGRYLIVWRVDLASGDDELRGQLVSSSGVLVGNQILIAAATGSTSLRFSARVLTGINSVNRFVVVYWQGQNNPYPGPNSSLVLARAINASSGAISSATTIFSSTAQTSSQVTPVIDFAVAGHTSAALTASDAWVVYTTNNGFGFNGVLTAVRLQVGSSGAPTVVNTVAIASGFIGDFAITPSDATAQRWLLAWVESSGSSTRWVNAQTLNAAGPCGTPVLVFVGAAGDGLTELTCATSNGASFLVGWANTLGGADDLQVCPLAWSGTCSTGTLTAGTVLTLPPSLGSKTQPVLEFVKDKYVIAWRSQAGANPWRVRLLPLHPTTGAPAGADVALDSTIVSEFTPAVASRWSGGDTASDEALAVWTNQNGIRARRYEATGGGTVTSLGGACGIPGFSDVATYGGLPTLGTTFTIELLAPTAPVLALIVGFTQSPLACGPCTIVPSPDLVLAGAGPVPVAVPLDANLIGFELYTQWLQLRPSGCPLLPDFGFSNTLKFTIAE